MRTETEYERAGRQVMSQRGDTAWRAGADACEALAPEAGLIARLDPADFGESVLSALGRAALRPAEATLVGTALGLGEVAQWMTKIRPDMVGVVNRRAVRWAALAQTPIESQLIGPPTR